MTDSSLASGPVCCGRVIFSTAYTLKTPTTTGNTQYGSILLLIPWLNNICAVSITRLMNLAACAYVFLPVSDRTVGTTQTQPFAYSH